MPYMGIIPEATSTSTQVARGLGGGIGSGLTNSVQFAEKMALQKAKSQSLSKATKQLEKEKTIETGLGTIQKMRELLPYSGGFTSDPMNQIQALYPGETQSKRAELESLGRSLIPLVAAGVPIRNQKEFEEYKKTITDPSASPAKLEGALNALESIFERSMGSESEEERGEKKSSKMKFDLSNPKHKSRRDQVLKKTGGDREKAEMVLSKEFEL